MSWIKMKIFPVAPGSFFFFDPLRKRWSSSHVAARRRGEICKMWSLKARQTCCCVMKWGKPFKPPKRIKMWIAAILRNPINILKCTCSNDKWPWKLSEDFPPTSPALKFWLALSSQTCPFRGTRCNPLRWASICTRARRPWCTSPVGGLWRVALVLLYLFYLLSPQSPMDSTSRIPIPIRTPIVLINQQSSGDNHRYWGWNEVYSIINE